MMSEPTVLIIAFVIMCFVLFKPVLRQLKSIISSYSDRVHSTLDTVYDKYAESSSKVSEAIARSDNIESEISQILSSARLEAKLFANQQDKKNSGVISKRLDKERKKALHNNEIAIQELSQRVVDLSLDYASKLISLNLSNDKKRQLSVIDCASEKISSKYN